MSLSFYPPLFLVNKNPQMSSLIFNCFMARYLLHKQFPCHAILGLLRTKTLVLHSLIVVNKGLNYTKLVHTNTSLCVLNTLTEP